MFCVLPESDKTPLTMGKPEVNPPFILSLDVHSIEVGVCQHPRILAILVVLRGCCLTLASVRLFCLEMGYPPLFRIASPPRPNRLSLGGKLKRMRLRRPRVYPGNRGSHTLIVLSLSAPVGVGRWAGWQRPRLLLLD